MMARLTHRLEKLEAAREAYGASLSDEQIEARIGPGFMTFLDRQPLEDLTQLAEGDSSTAQRLWKDYLEWYEEQQP